MKRAAAGIILGMAVAALMGTAWNGSYESSPAGTDLASDLDTFIQGFKTEVRQRLEVEHIFGGSTDDNGLHAMGSARCFVQNTAPTAINGGTAALGQYNSAASTDGGTTLTTDEVGSVTRDIGAGRCWVDLDGLDNTAGTSDDRQLNVWDETANTFLPITTRDLTGAGLGFNQIYNGSFEVTDGTGAVAPTGSCTSGTPCPVGWVSFNTVTVAYLDPTGVSEGEGIALRTTGAGGALEGVRQSLAGLKASTAYLFRARVRAAAGDSCTLAVSDGTTTTSDVSATTGVFETLEAALTTTAVPATVAVDLESTADTDICDWDEVTVFERAPAVAQPGIQVCRDVDTTTTAAYATAGTWDDALVSCAVTPPGPGYIVMVHAQVVADNEAGTTDTLAGRIMENSTAVAIATTTVLDHNDSANHFEDLATIPLFFTRVNPTPGTTLTYTLQATPTSRAGTFWDRNLGDDGADLADSAALTTTIEVTLIPTR